MGERDANDSGSVKGAPRFIPHPNVLRQQVAVAEPDGKAPPGKQGDDVSPDDAAAKASTECEGRSDTDCQIVLGFGLATQKDTERNEKGGNRQNEIETQIK